MDHFPYWWKFFKPYHLDNSNLSFYDLIVIGSGYAGISAASEAAKQGMTVLVIDRAKLGEGASTRSAGMVSGGLNLGKKINLIEEFGIQKTKKFINESIESYNDLQSLIKGQEKDLHFYKSGRLVLGHSNKKTFTLNKKTNFLNEHSELNIEMVSNLNEEITSSYYKSGMLVKDAASINPALFYEFLLNKCLSLKCHFKTNCSLINYKKNNHDYVLQTSKGLLKTKYLIIATNGYSDKTIGAEHNSIIGVPTYMCATSIIGEEQILKLMPKLRMYSDTKNDLYYFRPSPDFKRIIFGGFPIWKSNLEKTNYVENFFLEKIKLIFPNIKNFYLENIWSGKVGVTLNTLPKLEKRGMKISVYGCNGSGVALMPYLGKRSAKLVIGKTNYKSVIEEINHRQTKFKNLITLFLPFLGFYYKFKENLENKFNI